MPLIQEDTFTHRLSLAVPGRPAPRRPPGVSDRRHARRTGCSTCGEYLQCKRPLVLSQFLMPLPLLACLNERKFEVCDVQVSVSAEIGKLLSLPNFQNGVLRHKLRNEGGRADDSLEELRVWS